jgi:SAM-dependent methyltransferase
MTKINRIINKDRDLNILEIGSTNENFANFFLKSIDIKEYKYTIVDPHINNRFENLKNFRAINGFFDYHLFNNEKYDLIITNNLLEHIRDLNKFMEDVEKILKDNGIFIFQIPCLENDNIIESIVSLIADNHINYFSENNIKHIFSFFDMKVEFINFNGSIYATATKQKIVNKLEEYDKLRQKLKKKILLKKDFIKKIEQLRDKEVVIYGLTTASIPLLNRLEKIKYIIDDKYYNYKIIDKELISFKQFLDLQANRDFIVVPVSYSRESIVAMIKKI